MLKLLTLNIAHGRSSAAHQLFLNTGTILQNLSDVAQVIAREQPALVALQEVDAKARWSGGIDQLRRLQEETGLAHSLQGEHMQRFGLRYGTALLSTLALHDVYSERFDTMLHFPPKGFVVAGVHHAGRDIDVASVHLDFLSRRVRTHQIDQLIRCLKLRGRPCIVMGDFNCEWHSPDSALPRLVHDLGLSVYEPLHEKLATFPATGKRWDWIFISSELRFQTYANLRDQLSDHSAVVAEVL